RGLPNPTNAVGGSFILSLHATPASGSPESHQRSWWIVHTQPTRDARLGVSRIPPTQLVDRSYSAYTRRQPRGLPNPTNAVGGSFILSLHATPASGSPKSHQRSWWIVHTQPTRDASLGVSRIPPTQLVDRSYSAYTRRQTRGLPNPTNAVGGSFILSLHATPASGSPKSHQRSWWIVHTQPTRDASLGVSQIPPTQLVDRSYSAYTRRQPRGLPNPTNAVGGSFILSLHATPDSGSPESHQRSWWIVHTQPTRDASLGVSRIPPTQLVDRSYSAYTRRQPRGLPNPTNAVGGSFILSLHATPASGSPESHQRSWWIVHTQPTRDASLGVS